MHTCWIYRLFIMHVYTINFSDLAPEVPKPAVLYKRRIRQALVVFALAARILPGKPTCPKSAYPIHRLFPPTHRNMTRPMTDTTTQTKTRATSSRSGRLRIQNLRPPIPEAASKARIRTWTMSVSVLINTRTCLYTVCVIPAANNNYIYTLYLYT